MNNINNVGNTIQRLGKIRMNQKKKNLSMMKTSDVLDPEITSLVTYYYTYHL